MWLYVAIEKDNASQTRILEIFTLYWADRVIMVIFAFN